MSTKGTKMVYRHTKHITKWKARHKSDHVKTINWRDVLIPKIDQTVVVKMYKVNKKKFTITLIWDDKQC